MSATNALLERTTRLRPQDVLLVHQEPLQLVMLVLSARRESMQNLLLLLALLAQERESTQQRKDRQHAPQHRQASSPSLRLTARESWLAPPGNTQLGARRAVQSAQQASTAAREQLAALPALLVLPVDT
jgi:hypothetical protein